MAGIIDRIKSWATDLAYWERSALEKIASGVQLTSAVYEELLTECMQDGGLTEMPTSRPPLSFPNVPAGTAVPSKCHLERLFNLENVNALPPGQELQFGPQLTMVYGDNAAGKSGYARPLGCAAFARGEREVLPNAAKGDSKGVPKAHIEISQGGTKQIVTWTVGKRCPELTGFYVFDTNSLSAHLTGSNSIGYAPAGLSLLTRLADVTDRVREGLKAIIRERDAPHSFGPWFEGDSVVSQKIETLDARTDLSELEKLGQMTEEEITQIGRLEKEIFDLKSNNTMRYAAKRRQEVADLDKLVKAIEHAGQLFGDRAVEETEQLINHLRTQRREAERSGVDQFKSELFTHIGTDTWRRFIVAAKALADAEASQRSPYPAAGDHCLLCRQPLQHDAVSLIQKMWDFLKSDAQARLEAAQRECEKKASDIQNANLSYFEGDSSARRLLESELPTIVPIVESQVAACSARREEMIDSLRAGGTRSLPPLVTADVADIRKLIQVRTDEIAQMEKSDTSERLKQCELSLRQLKHRRGLGEKMSQVREYVMRKRWVSKARDSVGSTRHITMKYNELFKELVTDEYTRVFQATLNRFKTKLLVTIDTRGQKGETVRQISLSPTVFAMRFPVEKILSDGEKTAVAIADFLTEASLDESASGIILDDPITSLDNNWKGVLAQFLAEHGKVRQVVVFTHDLPFLYHITEHAEKLGVNVVTHWIREEGGQPGFVYAGNSPVCEKAFRSANIARDCYSKAKNMPPTEQQSWLQQGFGALRTSYEALVIFELFNGVVERFEERISFDKLSKVRIDPKIVEEIVDRMAGLSRHIIAHLHSDTFAAVKPTPAMLLEEIEVFERIRKSLKAFRNRELAQPQASGEADSSSPKP